MRIRNAAIAGATAIAVAFGGTTIATAAETPAEPDTAASAEGSSEGLSSDDAKSEEESNGASLSSRIGDSDLVNKNEDDNKNTQFNGRDVFGSSKDHENIPSWAQSFYALTIVASIGSLIGLVVGPAANYIQFGQ
ncbi:hypothetical protein [Corynebacterium sp.]|uniref:hypothetical protein n=1 Tax=Corynebacterium sp. TaxID=1720 RepID=UPI0028B0109B|nr:hypothetical protein [Corynebacterium sp.]